MEIKKILSKIRANIYLLIFLIFVIWMLFLDTHSMKIHMELNQEIKELESEKRREREVSVFDDLDYLGS